CINHIGETGFENIILLNPLAASPGWASGDLPFFGLVEILDAVLGSKQRFGPRMMADSLGPAPILRSGS
ncbi:hypothetical protein, partial [Klebsiella pneumoniae]|uniref:hypothetical protein n=1 Tax=Klebsiella pneumoniae TaxID=573 RepID=UPI0039ECCF3D